MRTVFPRESLIDIRYVPGLGEDDGFAGFTVVVAFQA